MNEKNKQMAERKASFWIGLAILLGAVLLTSAVSLFLYQHTVNLLTSNLRKREMAIVQTAAVQFESADLNELQEKDDYLKPQWAKVVKQLIKIRENNSDIVFAYILRRSKENLNEMVFIADSHSLDPFAKIDLDQNGIIDEADSLNWPGQIYEEVPNEAFEGLLRPTANNELYEDQWGILMSGYAPIFDENGNSIAVMVVDIRANDFYEITRQTFFPFLAFILVLLGVLLILSASLIKIWNKRVELIEDIDRQKDELMSIVSHQLATPVSSVKWYVEMLLDGDLGQITPDQATNLRTVQSVTNDLSDLVSMILDVSRIQLGKMKAEKAEVNINELISQIILVIQPRADEKNIKLNVKIDHKKIIGFFDARLMRMAIENLLSNAIKYTPLNGMVTLSIQKNTEGLNISVEDTGCGIPEKDQKNVFSKLFRASNVRQKFNGNGFGLYIAKGAILAQEGKIWFKSEENKGTTFYITLPA